MGWKERAIILQSSPCVTLLGGQSSWWRKKHEDICLGHVEKHLSGHFSWLSPRPNIARLRKECVRGKVTTRSGFKTSLLASAKKAAESMFYGDARKLGYIGIRNLNILALKTWARKLRRSRLCSWTALQNKIQEIHPLCHGSSWRTQLLNSSAPRQLLKDSEQAHNMHQFL